MLLRKTNPFGSLGEFNRKESRQISFLPGQFAEIPGKYQRSVFQDQARRWKYDDRGATIRQFLR
ncbi:MAG: hypothetical protein A2Z97_06850 [Bdellovibrionales bacterium GWB1_52_6]|nr:MAG: hypothetical protein A2Z97_06850 [Bdellovibrionales bacterium GWB1_52_6]